MAVDIDDLETFAIQLAREAGEVLQHYWGQRHTITFKSSPIDLLTEADLASERLIVESIRARYPDHSILAEEGSGQEQEAEYHWLVDPLDGTTNYAHGFPVFCVVLAVQRQEETILGVIYDPLRDELFTARQGRGATLNGRPLRVSNVARLAESLVATGFAYRRASLKDNNLPEFGRVMPRVQGVRRAGSAALDLAYLAAGRLDGYWEAHLSPWDWAAGALMVCEAGGTVTDREGHPWQVGCPNIVASNGRIHQELLAVLNA